MVGRALDLTAPELQRISRSRFVRLLACLPRPSAQDLHHRRRPRPPVAAHPAPGVALRANQAAIDRLDAFAYRLSRGGCQSVRPVRHRRACVAVGDLAAGSVPGRLVAAGVVSEKGRRARLGGSARAKDAPQGTARHEHALHVLAPQHRPLDQLPSMAPTPAATTRRAPAWSVWASLAASVVLPGEGSFHAARSRALVLALSSAQTTHPPELA